MSDRLRLLVGVAGAIGVMAVMLWGFAGLPPSGEFQGAYGRLLNAVATAERSATDVVTAINFDYRGFDTLGEEFILFISVVGVVMLLRKQRGEMRAHGSDEAAGRQAPRPSAAVRLLGTALVGFTACLGVYVTTHGQLSPGGGFQGGVVVATAILVTYLVGGRGAFHRVAPEPPVRILEAAGAGGFVLVGAAGVAAGGAFLQNVLPLGTVGSVISSGTIAVISLAVGLEVAAAFMLVVVAFVVEVLERRVKR